ncbi:hypothetical protein ACLBXI_25855 [Bacillus cereus]
MGSEDLAKKVDKEIGLSKGIEQSVQGVEPASSSRTDILESSDKMRFIS